MATKIYVDQGHNPENPNAGAEGNGLREQDITYKVGIELAELLRENPEFEVRLSRPNPTATGVEAFAYSRDSRAFALGEDIVEGISATTGLQNRGMKVRPGLYVLRKTAMPAVLVELGFITNPSDAALMNNNPALFARGIYNGIQAYFGHPYR